MRQAPMCVAVSEQSRLLPVAFITFSFQICDAGGVRILAMVLEKAHNDTELTACCNTLWQLCFSDDGAKAVDENLKLKDFLSKLKVS